MKANTVLHAMITLLLGSLAATHAATRTWTGGGADSFWTNAANWGGTAPVAGDDLVFPAGAARPSSTNNFSSLSVNRIQFWTNGYTFSGNTLAVLAGVNATNPLGVNIISLDLVFPGAQGLTNTGSGGLLLMGSNSVSGTLSLFGPGAISFFGTVAGTGGLVCSSLNGVVLNSANSYSGTTEVTGGLLAIGYPTSLGSAAGGTTVRAGAKLDISANVTVTEPLLLEGTLSNGDDSNTWSGPITLSGTNAEIFVNAGTLTVSGVISGAGGVTTRNFEALRFTGANTYSGDTTIADGSLIVDGQQPSSRIVLAGGTLGGAGRVGEIVQTTGGTVAPGASAGILTSSNIVFGSGTTFRVEINGTTAGTGYDQLAVEGSATLGGSLQVSNTISPAVGATFKIIDNDGFDDVTNTFAGLPEGAIITSGGQTFVLSYKGGTGNDVVLTCRCLNPCNLRLHDGPTPYEVYIRWEVPLGPVDEYIIYRNGLEVQRYPASTFNSFPLFYDKFLQPNHSYTYQVVATFTNGAPSQASNPLLVVAPPPTPVVGTNKVMTLLLQFADYVEEPYSTNYVNGLMFTNPFSVSSFYREISYGKFSLEGSIYGWFTLPGYASNYCTIYNATYDLWYGPNMQLITQHALNVVPPAISNIMATADIAQYIVSGLGTVGLSGGRTKLYAATNGFGFGSCIHEISHGINNYGHSGGWLYLPGGYSAGPSLADLRAGGCFPLTYGDSYDPLGDASSYHHHTWFKERAGWLSTNNIQWIDHDGLYQVWAIEQNTNQVQALKFDLGNEMFYFFEYRTLTGFDGPSTPTYSRAPIDAVLGRIRLSYSQGTGDIETMLPYPFPGFVPQVLNPGTPFLDPYRNLRVEVVSKSGGVATLRVSGTTNVFRVTNVRKLGVTGQNVELTFNSLQGAKYIAQASTDFTSWQTIQTNILAPTNITTATLTNAGTLPKRFFRLGVDNGLP